VFQKVKRYLTSPYYALGDDMIVKHPEWMSDKYFIRVFWKRMMGYPLDLKHPKTFNEKLQWMKLYDRNPMYPILVDKVKVKEWVAERIGGQYVIPTLAVYDSAEEIDLQTLPEQFVLKCNHDSGGVIICKDKSSFNLEEARSVLSKRLEHDFYQEYREWPYKMVERKILAEQYISDGESADLPDYKVFTFGGEPKLIQVDFDRFSGHKRNIYDISWNLLDARIQFPPQKDRIFEKPECLDELLALSRVLSRGLRQVRTDFYIIRNRIFFGEMTLFHGAGTERFTPAELGLEMGSWIDLT